MSATASLASLIEAYGSLRDLGPGRALVYQGDPGEAAFVVVAGKVRRYRIQGEGRRSLGEAGPGSWLCLPEVYLGAPCQADLVALGALRVRRVSRYNFFELLREPAFKDLVLGEVARDLLGVQALLGAQGADARVAAILAGMAAPPTAGGTEGTRRLCLTQADLAEAAGLTRETTNRALARLEAAGLLETGRGEILVYNLEALRDWEGPG